MLTHELPLQNVKKLHRLANLFWLKLMNVLNVETLVNKLPDIRVNLTESGSDKTLGCLAKRGELGGGRLTRLLLHFTLIPVLMQNAEALFLILNKLVLDISANSFWINAEEPAVKFSQRDAEQLA